MKVYFEVSGCGCGKLGMKVYVNPKDNGSGYHYGADGQLHEFSWVNPKKAVVFDSSELPENLWYSIQHGVHHVEIEESKRTNWTWDDIEYTKVSPEEVEAYLEANRRIEDVKSIDDFKELYPLIKKSGRINRKIMNKLFSFYDISEPPVNNGEIGIQFYNMTCIYRSLLVELGLEEIQNTR